MRIVCLGAAGAMGRRAARELAASAAATELILADRHPTADPGTVRAGLRTRHVSVDVADPDALAALLASGVDVVVSCVGPFYRFGEPVLRAAIAAGVTYVDLCDDPEPTQAMLALDAEAKAAGVSALVGMGASPGVSNLLARRAAAHLDTVDDCYTVWPLDVPAPGQTGSPRDEGRSHDGHASAAAVHLMAQVSGRITVLEHGEPVRRPPLQPVRLTYPGHGHGVGYTVGHPEPLTLGASLGVTGSAANVMLTRRSTAAFLVDLAHRMDVGGLTPEQAAERAVKPTPSDQCRSLLRAPRYAGARHLPAFFALLHGRRDGQATTVGCRLTDGPDGMDAATTIPAVLAVEQHAHRSLPPGVHPPERVIDHDRLLAGLIPHCASRPAGLDELAPVTVVGTSDPGARG